jgi:hypothetical protein
MQAMSSVVVGRRVRLVLAILYATALVGFAVWFPQSSSTVPMLMIALGLPLVFRLVPRNYLYGMRSPRTLWTTDEIWYRQNVITGIVMVGIGVAWLFVVAIRAVSS